MPITIPPVEVRRRHHRLVLRLAALVCVLPVVLLGCQHRLLYHPQPIPDHLRREAEPLPYRTDQGQQVAWYVAPRRGGIPARLWLCCGGNGSLGLFWLDQVRTAPRDDDGFLLIDYPGYGDCAGSPTPERIRISVAAAVTSLAARWDHPVPVAVLGHSLGAAVALRFAADHPVERIVLLAPFTSMLDMARSMVGWPLCYLLHHRFDNRAPLAAVLQRTPAPPVLIVHGARDEIVPVRMGRELGALPGVTYRELPEADHNGILDDAGELLREAMR